MTVRAEFFGKGEFYSSYSKPQTQHAAAIKYNNATARLGSSKIPILPSLGNGEDFGKLTLSCQ